MNGEGFCFYGPMADKMVTGPPGRGRPRSEKARNAIVAATAELLLEAGLDGVAMDAVAERAGVSKATIYRWWPTKETLALDALYYEWEAAGPRSRPTDSLRDDLASLLRPWLQLVTQRPYARVVAALLAKVQTDPVFAEQYRARVLEPRRDRAASIFQRAIERGEIASDTKIDVAVDLLYGPLYHRLIQGHAPPDERFMRDVVDILVTGLETGPGGHR
jgi:AcrR family transcriptional regulator